MILPWGSTLKISKGCPPRRVVPGISAVFVVLPPDFHRTWFTLPSPLFFLDLPLYCLPLWQSGSQVFSWWSSGWGKAGSSLGQNYMGGGTNRRNLSKIAENRQKLHENERILKNRRKPHENEIIFWDFMGGDFEFHGGGILDFSGLWGGGSPPHPPH